MDPTSNDSGAPFGLTNRLERLQAGQLDRVAVESVFQRVHAEALKIARAQHRRRGSPDGVAGASDLANSQAARIWENAAAELRNVATTDDLRRVLHRMLLDRWIERRRKQQRRKRGGGKVVAVSQLAKDSQAGPFEDVAGLSPPDEAETALDLADLLKTFPASGQERSILELLIAGHTQAEIGQQLKLSRDAVGRRIRQTIAPAVARLLKPEADQ